MSGCFRFLIRFVCKNAPCRQAHLRSVMTLMLLTVLLTLSVAQCSMPQRLSARVRMARAPVCGMAAKKRSKQAKAAKSKPAARGFGTYKPKQAVIPSLQLNTGATLPALCFGTYKLGGEELKTALQSAIAAGYRHFDTARAYQNENIVGAAIAESGVSRDDFFLTSKLWGTDHGRERAQQAIEETLAALDTTYLDSLLIHGPGGNAGRSPEEIVALRQETWLAMEEEHAAGKLRSIGVSNFEPRHIESLLSCGTVMPAINQIECHAHLAQAEIRDFCAEHGILVQAYGSVGATGLRADPVVQEIAAAHKRTPAQISLRYTYQSHGACVLARTLTPRRVAENAKIFDFELSAAECAELDARDTGQRSYWDNSEVP